MKLGYTLEYALVHRDLIQKNGLLADRFLKIL